MPCYQPLEAWRALVPDGDGRFSISFRRQDEGLKIKLPCGQCIGCRLERSRQWAVRCMHEAAMHSFNSFVTLSYSDEFLPSNKSLNKRHFQLFMKKLRKRFVRVRFYHCGEYGEETKRPHYHALLFNVFFSDRVFLKFNDQGHRLYTSELLDSLWGLGNCWIGDVTFDSAAYVARYCTKKVTGQAAEAAYTRIDGETGEVVQVLPEYATMSLKPGIGATWYAKFKGEVYPSDFIIRDGVRMLPPRAYDKYLEMEDAEALRQVRARRSRDGQSRAADNTPDRLRVREEVKKAQVRSLTRKLK